MNGRTVKKLTDLEIDEVSLVDRAANQHARVAIAKNDTSGEDHGMPSIYDEAGDEVFDDELEIGGKYFDDAGNEYVYVEDEGAGEQQDEYFEDGSFEADYAENFDGEMVGKASWSGLTGRVGNKAKDTRANLGQGYRDSRAGTKTVGGNTARRTGAFLGRGNNRYAVGGGAAGGTAVVGGGAYAVNRRSRNDAMVGKSLGQSVLEELSKSLDQGERDEVISKAMDYVALADRRARNAESIAKSLADEREYEGYVELAKSYDLPVDPYELGAVLKSAAETMSDAELGVLDRILKSAGESALYDELGSGGSHQSSNVMDEVDALANETVGKFDSMSHEQAVAAMFSANPTAYDEYLAERR